MNKLISAMICWPLLIFPMAPIATATALPQNNLLQGNDTDSAYRDNVEDDRETQLKKEKIRSVMAELESKRQRVMSGQDQVFALLECQTRLNTAMLDFHMDPEKIISLLESNVEATKMTETYQRQRLEATGGRPDEYAQATYIRADAELQLLRAKQKFNGEGNARLPSLLQLENASEKSDQKREEAPQELGLTERQLPGLAFDDNRPAIRNDSIEEWKNGSFSPEPYKVNPGDDVETRLKKQRINMALMEKNHFAKLMDAGVARLDVAFDSQKRLVEAQLDFHTEPKEIVSLLQQALESATQVEAIVRDQFQEGAEVSIQQVGQATYNRLDFELKLLHAKMKYGLLDHSVEETKR